MKKEKEVFTMKKAIFTTLSIEDLTKALNSKKNGQFATVEFFSTPKTITGAIIYKKTKMQVLTKVDYTNRKDYVEPTTHRIEDSEYILDKALKVNHKTNNTLLTLFPFNGNYKAKKTYYDETGKEISEDEATAIIKPKKPSDKPLIFMTVNAENVISFT